MSVKDAGDLWYAGNLDVFLNEWFSDYEEARRALERGGGFLLPYRRQFFVCRAEAVRALGLDPEDPDWEKAGHDCARPADEEACRRLRAKREHVARGRV